MKRVESIVCGFVMAAVAASPLLAQQSETRTGQARTEVTSQLDAHSQGATVRVSQLTGMNIQNPQGKSVGEVSDMVLDTSTGKIRYVAVTYGGFLGIGNKMFAVPFEAFRFQQDRNNAKTSVLVLDVTQQQLEGAVGFDENSWPDFADQKFTSELDQRYRVNRNMRERDGKVDVKVDRNGVDVDVNSNREDK